MKRFQFKLQRLANVREVQEQQAREVWAAAERAAQLGEDRVLGLRQQIEAATREQLELQSRKQIPTSEVLAGQQLVDGLHRSLQKAEEQARLLREQAEAARIPWRERRAELQGLQRLEERATTDFHIEQERENAHEMDQIAMERSARQGRRGPHSR